MRLLMIPSISFALGEVNLAVYSIASFVAQDDECYQWFEVGSSGLMQIIFNDFRVINYLFRDVRSFLLTRV